MSCVDIDHTGKGICRSNNLVIIVPGVLPSEEATVTLRYRQKKYWIGELFKITKQSTNRSHPNCKYYSQCGGCSLQHTSYTSQYDLKIKMLKNRLKRIGKIEQIPSINEFRPSEILYYRNKTVLPVTRNKQGKLMMGYFAENTHDLTDIEYCPILKKEVTKIFHQIKNVLKNSDIKAHYDSYERDYLRHICIKSSEATGQSLIVFVTSSPMRSTLNSIASRLVDNNSNIQGIINNVQSERSNNIFGKNSQVILGLGYIKEEFLNCSFMLGHKSFFQVHRAEAECAVKVIIKEIKEQCNSFNVLDAYSGIGTISIPLAKEGYEVIGIEINSEACKLAKRNSELNNLSNTTFINGDVKYWISNQLKAYHYLILDPPRKGLEQTIIDLISKIKPHHIAYLSCNTATLSRDIAVFTEKNLYKIKKIYTFDFFPQTTHLECLAILEISNFLDLQKKS